VSGTPICRRCSAEVDTKPHEQNRYAIHFQPTTGRREPRTVLAASAGWAGATPGFGALVRPKPSRLRLGSLPPTLRQISVATDIDVDIPIDTDDNRDVVTERYSHDSTDDFNLVIAFQLGGKPCL